MFSLRCRCRLPRQTRELASHCGLGIRKRPIPQAPIFFVSQFPSPGKGNGELQKCHCLACLTLHVRFGNSFLMETAGKREYCTGVKDFGDPLWKTKHHLTLEHQFKGACAFQVLITNTFT